MKRIKLFEDFINEQEAVPAEKKKDFEHLPRLRDVVDKEFFAELKNHVFYWLNYQFLNKKFEMDSIDSNQNEITVWFSDKMKQPLYEYKATFTTVGDLGKVEKIEQVKLMIWIYEYETHELLTHTEMEIGLKYLSAVSFNNFIKKVKKRIIRTPRDGEDIENFKKKEKRRLGDNIY